MSIQPDAESASTGAHWRMLPNDLPLWHTVYQQTQRWLKAGVVEAFVHDLRMLMLKRFISFLLESAEQTPRMCAACSHRD